MSKRVQIFFNEPSLTKQCYKDECDINLIVKRYRDVGQDPMMAQNPFLRGQFGDFSEVGDYRSALHQVSEAKAYFEALPVKIRNRFNNDPAEFMDFVQNPVNAKELVDLGLAKAQNPELIKDTEVPKGNGGSSGT